MKNRPTPRHLQRAVVFVSLLASGAHLHAQENAAVSPSPDTVAPEDSEIVVLSPFEVTATNDDGYTAATTLAGNRLNTALRDIGSAVTVVTKEFLEDVAATDNKSLLQYTVGTEVGGTSGNFAGFGDAAQLNEDTIRPNENTRVRGLAAADNTRDYFRSDVPWDAYNVERVDLQRGANSILFGQGSPAGIINAGLKSPQYRSFGTAEVGVGSYGTVRTTLDLNRVLVPHQLAVRLALLGEEEKYRQDPAFSKDRRVFAAMKYEPKFLNHDGLMTTFKANFETGTIDSNNPRSLPPADAISPWFTELGQATYNQYQAFDHLSGRPNHGQFRVKLAATGAPNPAYEPYIGTFAFPSGRAGPTMFLADGNQRMMVTDAIGGFVNGGRGPNGAIDAGIGAMPDNGWVSLVATGQAAINGGWDYSGAGLWKNNLLVDDSAFDFYEKLIDGDSKQEWQDFDVLNLNLAQTYFQNKAGISLDLSRETYKNGQKAVLPGEVRLQIDPMAVYGDGSPDTGLVEGGEPYSDGTPNPNVGRAFVSSNNAWSNRSADIDHETIRATGFIKHDFSENGDNGFTNLLGTHTITGLLGRETSESDAREWQRYGIFDDAYYTLSNRADQRFNGALTPIQVIYLGDSLLGSTLSGARLPTIRGNVTMQSGPISYFNSTWNSTVPFDQAWQNGFYLAGDSNRQSTESENPANYVGWDQYPLQIVDANASTANRDRLTTRATLNESETDSQALVWQGSWLENSIVSIIGYRWDTNDSRAFSMSPSDFPVNQDRGAVDLSPDYYTLDGVDAQSVDVDSKSYSFVVHVTDLPFLRKATERWPVSASVYYNRSTNFKPDSSRVDIYGEQLPAPSGETVDTGIRFETKDGRFSVRVNRYETSNFNATSTQINAASIGNWMQLNQNFANVFEYNIVNGYDATAPGNTGNDTDIINDGNPYNAMRFNFHLFAAGRTPGPGDVVSGDDFWIVSPTLEHRVIDAVRTFQREVDPRFWTAWRINTFGDFGPSTSEATYTVPSGFAITEDNVSKGWEVEFSAQPARNWRVLLNASKTDARRTNIGNANMREFMDLVATSLDANGDGTIDPEGLGRLQHYWGTEDVVKAGKNWFDGEGLVAAPGSEWRRAQLVEDTTVPELREWRVNLVTNYAFESGFMKGVNVGGGLRYQSDVILGYPPTGNPDNPMDVEYDLGNPYRGPSETGLDLWVGYTRALSDKVDWQIQLNIRDAFQGKDLIPITYQPDGTPAAFRIAPSQTFYLTNRFSF